MSEHNSFVHLGWPRRLPHHLPTHWCTSVWIDLDIGKERLLYEGIVEKPLSHCLVIQIDLAGCELLGNVSSRLRSGSVRSVGVAGIVDGASLCSRLLPATLA